MSDATLRIEAGFRDRRGRLISVRAIGDDWLQVADVAPRDDQRRFVPALAARYLLQSGRGGAWTSLAVYADDQVVGHVMWAVDEADRPCLGGIVIAAAEQGEGVGRALIETMLAWFASRSGPPVVQLAVQPANQVGEHLYRSVGFTPTGEVEDGEIVMARRSD